MPKTWYGAVLGLLFWTVIGAILGVLLSAFWKYLLAAAGLMLGLAACHYVNIHWSRLNNHIAWCYDMWGCAGVIGLLIGVLLGISLVKDPGVAALLKGQIE